jgi:hypothetical protein
MNTVTYDLLTGGIVGFVSGATPTAPEGCGVLYTTKDLPDLADVVVLGGTLVPRMSVEYALSDKSSTIDKTLFWKEHRAKLLAESDYMMLPDVGDTAFQERAKTYRQQLRDLPKHANWPSLTLADIPAKPNPNAIQLSVF